MRTARFCPASSATRSEYSPAQVTRKSQDVSPAVWIARQPPELTMKRRYARAGDDFPALLPNQTRQRFAHGRIIGDAFLRHVNRLDASRMRLDLAQLLRD